VKGARIAGVLLAAGAGTRFGGAKLDAPLPDTGIAIGAAACRNLHRALRDVVAVVRPGDDALAALLRFEGARVTFCERAHEGMGVSLACGVAASSDAAGWVVALADMPWIAPATIGAVAQRLAKGASIALPRYRGRRGHPVGFAAEHRVALMALSGDEGARRIVAAHAAHVVELDVDDPGVLRDIDRREDLGAGSEP
jgi:molybdenum cofactor cytidylyltransferase